MKIRSLSVCLITSILFLLSAPLFGEEAATQDLGEVVVVATKTLTSVEKVGGSTIHVITAEEIEAKKITHLKDLLKEIPGIDIATNGGFGAVTSIFMRGADSKGVLVFVDGIMYNNPSNSNRTANIGTLTTDNIERIEIIKGSQSVLYGSNATAGVINIITKKGKKDSEITANMEAGSYNTLKLSAGASGSAGDLTYSVSASQFKTDGFSTADSRNTEINTANAQEADGAENLNVSASLNYEINEDFDVSLVLRKVNSTYELDDYGSGYVGDRFDGYPYVANPNGVMLKHDDRDQMFYGLAINNRFFDQALVSSLKINIGSDYYISYDNDNAKDFDYDGKSTEISWQGSMFVGESQEFTMGIGTISESMVNRTYSSSVATTKIDASVSNGSLWAQDKLLLDNENLIVPIGFRMDSHQIFGSAVSYRVAPSYHIEDTGLTFKASLGTGFQAPSLYQLYSSYGSTSLQPETSKTMDIGAEYKLKSADTQISLTYFNSAFDNQIGFDFATYKYANQTGITKTSGLEFGVKTDFSETTSMSYAATVLSTEDPKGAILVRRPDQTHTITGYTTFFDNLSTSGTISYVGKRKANSTAKDASGNTIEWLDAYMLVHISASYEITENFEVYGRVENLLDTYYEECWSYGTSGRAIYVGLKGTF